MASGGSRGAILFPALLLAGCGEAGDPDRSIDGGYSLGKAFDAAQDKHLAGQPCWRRERGRWHYSVGHCNAMLPAREMEGVWVTGFEESSFFPGPARMPDPDDPGRYVTQIELDRERVLRSVGHEPSGLRDDAVWLRFVGRRMRDPIAVDCNGTPHWVFIVDRLLGARYLGEMKSPRRVTPEEARRQPVTVAVRHEGRWGVLEAEAVRHCLPRKRGSGSN